MAKARDPLALDKDSLENIQAGLCLPSDEDPPYTAARDRQLFQ